MTEDPLSRPGSLTVVSGGTGIPPTVGGTSSESSTVNGTGNPPENSVDGVTVRGLEKSDARCKDRQEGEPG